MKSYCKPNASGPRPVKPMARNRLSSTAGFTLLEILVVLVVFGMLLTGLSKGIQLGVKAVDRQGVALGERAELDAVDRTVRELITHTEPGNGRSPVHIEGKEDHFRFQSRLPVAVALVTREADMTLMVDDQQRLILRWRPSLHELPFEEPPEPTDTVLLEKVDKLEFAYWAPDDGSGHPPGWRDEWLAPYLPTIIRLRVTFPKGDQRHWPAILIAPLVEQPGG
ncbi:MAG: ral secretion pathway protein [Aliidongia sp.]|nr:ral secretion pathway protein [Aliidongia sp.]